MSDWSSAWGNGHPNQKGRDVPEALRLARFIEQGREVATRVRPLYGDGGVLEERLTEPGLWMLVGLPSSGKSTLADAIRDAGRYVVQVDEIRAEHGWHFGQPEWQYAAYDVAHQRVAGALDAGVAFESTGVWKPARRWCVQSARERDVPVRAIVVGTDPGESARREALRRPANSFFIDVLASYIDVIAELPDEGYTSLHWLDEVEQRRLTANWTAAEKPR